MRRGTIARPLRPLIAFLATLAVFYLATSVAMGDEAGLMRARQQAGNLVVPVGTTVLAADASQEGHWTVVNAAGERFTAASPAEMQRTIDVIAAPARTGGRLVIVVSDDSIRDPTALAMLPREATLRLATATDVYPLRPGPPPVVEINPRIEIEVTDRAALAEIQKQLDRSIVSTGIRVLALQPGGAASLPPRIRFKSADGDLIEPVEPLRLRDVIAGLRRQTVVLTGHLDGRFLRYLAADGSDRTLIAEDLMTAAAANDVNLVILDTMSGRQPGLRNWLWLKSELRGTSGLQADSGLDGLLDLLAGDNRTVTVALVSRDAVRTTLKATLRPRGGAGLGGTLSKVATDIAGSITGAIEPNAINMYLVGAERQRELDRRLVRWLPSWVAWSYLGLLALGLAGASASWRWWARVWPPEESADYARRVGLVAARAVRLVAYAVLFMPAAALLALPAALFFSRPDRRSGPASPAAPAPPSS